MTKDEALRKALEALEEPKEHIAKHRRLEAITAIKEALAQPDPPPECQTEAEKKAFAFGWWKAMEAQRLAQPKQEPVGVVALDTSRPFVGGSYNGQVMPWSQAPAVKTVVMFKDLPLNAPLYTTPPQRTWIGLTDEDKQTAFDETQEGGGFWEFADAIEAKLKEKNT